MRDRCQRAGPSAQRSGLTIEPPAPFQYESWTVWRRRSLRRLRTNLARLRSWIARSDASRSTGLRPQYLGIRAALVEFSLAVALSCLLGWLSVVAAANDSGALDAPRNPDGVYITLPSAERSDTFYRLIPPNVAQAAHGS